MHASHPPWPTPPACTKQHRHNTTIPCHHNIPHNIPKMAGGLWVPFLGRELRRLCTPLRPLCACRRHTRALNRHPFTQCIRYGWCCGVDCCAWCWPEGVPVLQRWLGLARRRAARGGRASPPRQARVERDVGPRDGLRAKSPGREIQWGSGLARLCLPHMGGRSPPSCAQPLLPWRRGGVVGASRTTKHTRTHAHSAHTRCVCGGGGGSFGDTGP